MSSLFIGLMSGTSVDAIDAVLVEFNETAIKVHATHSYDWSPEVRELLLNFSQHIREPRTLYDITYLDRSAGKAFAKASLELLTKASVSPEQVTAIGSPGQTLYHNPNDKDYPYTWQLGDPNIIVEKTGITTIADFRRRDVAAGGQGAPLAPAFHNAWMRSSDETRIILNIGGIASITVLAADSEKDVIGYDIGPGNALLDAYSSQKLYEKMDKDGAWAATGKVETSLLKAFLDDPYFAKPAPKSTGRDYFNLDWLSYHTLGLPIKPENIQATLCQLTIDSIVQAILPYKAQRLLVCGGGINNSLIMNGLAEKLPDTAVETTATVGIDPDWVEAICFAWLAKQRIEEKPSNLASVTGARQEVSLGSVYI
jgi:anhydro-N-acetylmuramic acid kinase